MYDGRQADLVVLSGEERTFFEAQVRRHKTLRSLSDRCRMVLFCAEGLQSKEVTERLGVHEHMVGKWRRRFAQDGIEGLTAESGLSHTSIRRIWAAFGLQPHRSETSKLSRDPLFVDKVQDIIGL